MRTFKRYQNDFPVSTKCGKYCGRFDHSDVRFSAFRRSQFVAETSSEWKIDIAVALISIRLYNAIKVTPSPDCPRIEISFQKYTFSIP